ncbi:MAG: hypothetical protein Q9193_004162 [Seirophora villosa]
MACDPSIPSPQALDACSTRPDLLSQREEPKLEGLTEIDTTQQQPASDHAEDRVNKTLKRPREVNEEDDLAAQDVSGPFPPSGKRAKSGANSVPFWGPQAVKPLTEANLEIFLGSMSGSDKGKQPSSRKNSAQHPRVAALSSSKRSHAESEYVSENSSISTKAVAAINPRYSQYLMECGFDDEATLKPHADDLEALKAVMERRRDSPEPDHQLFHQTREEVKLKNEVSIVKRLSPILFPYRDLPLNNQKTSNLVYHDDVSWQEWGSNKLGYLPTPKPDLCIAFRRSAFTSQELAKMKSPYIVSKSYAPALTLEVKTALQSLTTAERQNANNMISLLQRDFALQKDIGLHYQMEKKIRFISATHDTRIQYYQAWFWVIEDNGIPKWCRCELAKVDFGDPEEDGFQTARRYNLNLCEYISDTVFKNLRKSLAASNVAPSTTEAGLQEEEIAADVSSVHLDAPSASSTGDSERKRRKKQ